MNAKSGLQAKNATPTPTFSLSQPGILQRQCDCGGVPGLTGECAECSSKRLSGQWQATTPPETPDNSPDSQPTAQLHRTTRGGYSFANLALEPQKRLAVQTKLKINEPGDQYEQQADRVAEQVMRMPEPSIQRQMEPEEDEEEGMIQRKGVANQITPLVQRQALPEMEEEEEEEEGMVQRKATANQVAPLEQQQESSEVPPTVHEVWRSPGQPLDAATRGFFEPRFGADLGTVRVHTDVQADAAAQSIHARAFTFGRNVGFAAGEYDPHSEHGRSLLAHELVHVQQQQTSSIVQRQPKTQDDEPGLKLPARVRSFVDLVDLVKFASQQAKTERQRAYVESVVGDFVRSDLLRYVRFEPEIKIEKYRDSTLRTETYYILVGQKPDGKEAKKPWSLIIDRQTTFELHGKIRGRMHTRDYARLESASDAKSARSHIDASAYDLSKPDPAVFFDAPFIDIVPLKVKLPKAQTYSKFVSKHPLLSLSATPKERVQALEKLIPDQVLVPPATTDVPVPNPSPGKTVPKTIQSQEDVEEVIRAAEKAAAHATAPRSRTKDTQSEELAQQEKASQKDDSEDPWYAGLLRALGALIIGLGLLAGLALVGIAAGLSATAAVLIAGTILLVGGFFQALLHRSRQSAYKGRPGAGIFRSFLDAIGVTGIQEALTGKDVATGRKLTPGEQTERGTLGAVNLLGLLLGARAALKKAPGETATDPFVFPGRKSPRPDVLEEPKQPDVVKEPPAEKLEPPLPEKPPTVEEKPPATKKSSEQVPEETAEQSGKKKAEEEKKFEEESKTKAEAERFEKFSKDPQTGEKNRKSIEEAEAILQAEKEGLVKNPDRPDLKKGDPNLDFKIDGPPPYRWTDVKTPVNRGNLTAQAEGIGKKSFLQKGGTNDVLHIIDLKNIPIAEKAAFEANVIKAAKEAGSSDGIVFINK